MKQLLIGAIVVSMMVGGLQLKAQGSINPLEETFRHTPDKQPLAVYW